MSSLAVPEPSSYVPSRHSCAYRACTSGGACMGACAQQARGLFDPARHAEASLLCRALGEGLLRGGRGHVRRPQSGLRAPDAMPADASCP